MISTSKDEDEIGEDPKLWMFSEELCAYYEYLGVIPRCLDRWHGGWMGLVVGSVGIA